MSTRTWIVIVGLLGVVGAGYKDDLAAMYVAIGTTMIVCLLHTIEVKINRLLDHYGITVWDSEIDKD